VITIEISPDSLPKMDLPPFEMQMPPAETDWYKTIVQTSESGDIVGIARQTCNPMQTVRFFQGKGGFCVIVQSGELLYFGLPGSRITLADTDVELPGEPIVAKSKNTITPLTITSQQTVTHQAMILGAGLATRFEPISGDTTGYPKPGVPLAGNDSVITAIAKLLKKHSFTRILVNTCYMPHCLKDQLQGLSGVEIVFIDEAAPSGTAGGLAKALEMGLVDRDKPIFIIQGDAITDADLSFLMNTHAKQHAAVTIGGQVVADEDVNKFGIIETDGSGHDSQSGNITLFKEKPSLAEAGRSRFANSGFYVLAPEAFPLFLDTAHNAYQYYKIYDYAQHFFPAVLGATSQKAILSHTTQDPMGFWAQAVGGYWSDIGNPVHYVEAIRDIYERHVEIDLPERPADYYENHIIYWPKTKHLALQQEARLSGNVIVARRWI
jgi:NDP-sugar pyrophosphorylase family protein